MKVLLIGANGFGRLHLDSLSRMDVDIEVFARNADALKEIAGNYSISRIYDDLPTALTSDADVVDIVLPHNMHREIAVECMRRKKHVLIEKPIATEITDAVQMINAGKHEKVKFMVAEQYYFDTSANWVVEAIRSGKIGSVLSVLVRNQRLFSGTGWRVRKETMGGGALVDGGVHFIDTFLNFGGEYSSVKAVSSKGIAPIEETDTTMSIFSFRSGAIGFLYYSWSYPYAPQVPAFEVVGTEGTIVEDVNTRPTVDFKFMKGKRYAFGLPVLNGKPVDIDIADAFDTEISGFLKSVREDTPVPMDPSVALRDLAAVKDIYAAASV